MSDGDAFKELLQSPVEPKRERRTHPDPDGRPPGTVWAALAGLLVGGLVVLAGYWLADGGDATAMPEVTTTTSTEPVVAPPADIDAFPPGYVAVNDRSAVRVERVLLRPDEAIVSMTVAVRRGLDPEATAGFWGGTWELLTGDGVAIPSEAEAFDPLAKGAFSVRFPGSFTANDLEGIRLTGEALRTTMALETSMADQPLPFAEPESDRFDLDGSVDLVIDTIDLQLEGGLIEWRFEGDDRVRGSVLPTVSLWTPTTPSGFPGVMPVRHFSTIASVFGTTVPAPFPLRGDMLVLDPTEISEPGSINRIEIDWAVTWFNYIDADVEIALGDAPVVVVDSG